MNKKLSTGIHVVLGFLLGVALNVAVIWIGFLISSQLPYNATLDRIESYGLVFIGVSQLLWQVPVIVLLRQLRRQGNKGLALGMILAASLTALLNATCWGLMWGGKIRIGG
ncbi:MAG TPA: hypothetical protein VFA71_01255 [Terriglobales bacterium]|nr:hypothetical protein [Terriglobales bacterium]